MLNPKPQNRLAQLKQLLQKQQTAAAINLGRQIVSAQPEHVAAYILLSHAYQQNTEFDLMLATARKAHSLQNQHFSTNIRLLECLIYAGEIAEAITSMDQLHPHLTGSAEKLAKLSELYLHCSQFHKVHSCLEQAVALAPDNPQYQFNLASANVSLGHLALAEKQLDAVIKNTPDDFDAYYNRATLRPQTVADNHIEQLEKLSQQAGGHRPAPIALGYALAKELEDLEKYTPAFASLKSAADHRRGQMSYQVNTDVEALKQIKACFSAPVMSQINASTATATPIFILGLPRSGTTLVERILASHSAIASLGEINSFAFSVMHEVGPNQGKKDLIERSAKLDFNQLARRYQHSTQGFGIKADLLIDKTPLNFLYLAHIKMAFPQARIIHLRRSAMDSCYAMYKTLFRMGYPFSYTLEDLGHYYLAYHQLMAHWRQVFPGGFMDLDYEQLVRQPEAEAKALIHYCGLDWEPQVLNFHQQDTPSATASASQVRQPIHSRSVGLWKNYARQLKPLQQQLSKVGIACD